MTQNASYDENMRGALLGHNSATGETEQVKSTGNALHVKIMEAIVVTPNVTKGSGVVDSNTQRVTLATDWPLVTAIGTPTDAVATTDTGTFSLISLFKRSLQKLTSLLSTQTITMVTTQSLAISGTSAQTAVVNAGTSRVIISTTTDCWVNLGASPTSAAHTTGSGFFLLAGASTFPISVTPSTTKISAIQDTASGYLSVLEIA